MDKRQVENREKQQRTQVVSAVNEENRQAQVDGKGGNPSIMIKQNVEDEILIITNHDEECINAAKHLSF